MRLLVKNGEGEEEDEGEHAASEAAGAGAATAGAGTAADESDMVFEGEEQPALPPEMLKAKAKKGGEAAAAAAGGKKSYAGEDGVKYRFNEGTGEWEEALPGDEGESEEEEDDEEDEEDEDEEPRRDGGGATAGGGGGQQQQGVQGGAEKRKRKKKKKSGWDKESNRWIYITGLPVDVTPEEVRSLEDRSWAAMRRGLFSIFLTTRALPRPAPHTAGGALQAGGHPGRGPGNAAAPHQALPRRAGEAAITTTTTMTTGTPIHGQTYLGRHPHTHTHPSLSQYHKTKRRARPRVTPPSRTSGPSRWSWPSRSSTAASSAPTAPSPSPKVGN